MLLGAVPTEKYGNAKNYSGDCRWRSGLKTYTLILFLLVCFLHIHIFRCSLV